jgi:hypothetical protein
VKKAAVIDNCFLAKYSSSSFSTLTIHVIMSDPAPAVADNAILPNAAAAAAAAAPLAVAVDGNQQQQQQQHQPAPAHAAVVAQQQAPQAAPLSQADAIALHNQQVMSLTKLTMATQMSVAQQEANTKKLMDTLLAEKAAAAKKDTQDSCAKEARALRKQGNREKALMLVGVASIDDAADRNQFAKACLEVISATEDDVIDIEEPNTLLQQATKALSSLSKEAQDDLFIKTKLKKRTAAIANEDGCIRCGRNNHTYLACTAVTTKDGGVPTMSMHAGASGQSNAKFARGGAGSARGGGPIAGGSYGYGGSMPMPYSNLPPAAYFPQQGLAPYGYSPHVHFPIQMNPAPNGPRPGAGCWNCGEGGHQAKFCQKPPMNNASMRGMPGNVAVPQPPIPVSSRETSRVAAGRVHVAEAELGDEWNSSQKRRAGSAIVIGDDAVARESVDVRPMGLDSRSRSGASIRDHSQPVFNSPSPCIIDSPMPLAVSARDVAISSSSSCGSISSSSRPLIESASHETIAADAPSANNHVASSTILREEESIASKYSAAAVANLIPDDVESDGQLASMYASTFSNVSVQPEANTSSSAAFDTNLPPGATVPVLTGRTSSEEEMMAELEWTGMPAYDLSLRRTIQNFFQSKKKVLSGEQIAAQVCALCEKKGHTREGCPDQIQQPSLDRTEEDRWVRRLIQMPRVNIDRLNRGLSKEEGIRRWLERGAKLNEGNPWLNSTKREDSLRRQLGYHKAMGMSSVHIGWIGFGVPLNFIREQSPEILAFRNNSTADEEAEFVDQEHAACLADGTFVEVQRHQLKGICPLQVERHPVTGKKRLCQNLKWINGHLPNVEFKMESLHVELGDVVQPGDKVFTTDLEKAYYCVALHPDAQPYLGWMWRGRYYMPTCLVFGLSTAPRIFTKIMRPMMGFMRSLGIRVLGMIDDYMWAARPEEAESLVKAVQAVLPQLGFKFNTKCIWEPADEVLMLGMLINTKDFIVKAPAKKIEAALNDIRRVLVPIREHRVKFPPSLKLIQQITGRLMSMMLALPAVRIYTRELYRCVAMTLEAKLLNPNFPPFVSLTPAAVEELEFWDRRLQTHNGLSISCRENQVEVLLWSDASDVGWGGEAVGVTIHAPPGADSHASGTEGEGREAIAAVNPGPRPASMEYGALPRDEIAQSSTRRELVGLMQLARTPNILNQIKGKRIKVYMDSIPALRNLINGGGPKEHLTAAVREWVQFCELHDIKPVYEWIPRAENWRADKASKLHHQQHTLRSGELEKYIRKYLSNLAGDLNRQGKNHFLGQVPIFTPMFHQIDARVEMIRSQLEEAIIVVPVWPSGGTSDWYRRIVEHSVARMEVGRVRDAYQEPPQTGHNDMLAAFWLMGRRGDKRRLHCQRSADGRREQFSSEPKVESAAMAGTDS